MRNEILKANILKEMLYFLVSMFLIASCSKKSEEDSSTDPAVSETATTIQQVQQPKNNTSLGNAASPEPAAPIVIIQAIEGFGPHATPGPTTRIWGVTNDMGSGIADTGISIQEGTDSCLNDDKTAFNVTCPHYLSAGADSIWQLNLDDSIFLSGTSYKIDAKATGKLGKYSTASRTYAWDASLPSFPSTLSVSEGPEELTLNWEAVSTAESYIVIASKDAPVTFYPTSGAVYTTGDELPGGHYVLYSGSSTSAIDTNLEAYSYYYYKVFSANEAKSISSEGIIGSGLPYIKPKFLGLTYAALVSPNQDIRVEWQPFATPVSSNIYEVYISETPANQDFTEAPIATVTGKHFLNFRYTGTSSKLYIVVRERNGDGMLDTNLTEQKLELGKGYHHIITSNGRLQDMTASDAYLQNAWAVKKDKWDNTIFSGRYGTIHVYCSETTNAPYCKSRTQNHVYTIIGRDGRSKNTDPLLVSNAEIGYITSIDIDDEGNIFAGDISNYGVWAFCFEPKAKGFCRGKKFRTAYSVTGNIGAGNGADDVEAATSKIGQPYSIALDSNNNLLIADYSYYRIRLICFENESAKCSGKTIGNSYRWAGTGANIDGADDEPIATAGMGRPTAIAVDAKDNVYIHDYTKYRIRAICQDNTVGFCSGKTINNMYHLAGSGVRAASGHDQPANGNDIERSFGMAIDSKYNLFYNEIYGETVKGICFDTTSDGYCKNKTVGNIYTVAGTGLNGDGNNTIALAAAVGDARGMALDSHDNIFLGDSSYRRIRAICFDVTSDGFCKDKLPNYHYRMIGSGSSPVGAEHRPSISEPIGSAYGLTIDGSGNVYTSDISGRRIYIHCYNQVGFCADKPIGNMYYFAGTGGQGDGTDGFSIARATGQIYGIASDDSGNLILADYTYRRIRAVCSDSTVPGPCFGKTEGYSYRIAGTGAAGNGADNADPLTTAIERGIDTEIDSLGNVYFISNTKSYVYTICYNTTNGGFCNGKTQGNMYIFSGTGTRADGSDGNALTTTIGVPKSLAIDSSDNVYIGDDFYKIRVVCQDTTAGFCNGKTSGNIYTISGTGAIGNGADDSLASTTAMGLPIAITVDDDYNIFVADHSYFRIRAICLTPNTNNFCEGKTANNVYRLFGSGTDAEGASNIPGSQAHIGNTGWGALEFTPNGHLLRLDDFYSIRIFLNH